ncbi:MAG TPA: hypothetical protein DDY72_03125 [Verrucomicrobia bacterium]|mgnify:FL=1|nr:hypothetical protein [Verrucomicrobiota bacterium]
MPVNSFENYKLNWIPPWRRGEAPAPTGPLYLALAAALEADILSGRLPTGTKLPPQRELADYLDVNFTTLTRAYDLCRSKNLIYGIIGRGTFVAARGEESVHPHAARLLDLGVVQAFPKVGEDEIVAAARAVLSRESARKLFSYANREGAPRHRRAGQIWLRRTGIDVPLEQIAVFPGVQSALATTLLSVFSVGDTLATDPFTYANLISLARLAHVKLLPIQNDDQGMIPDELAYAARKHNLRGVFLMPECANPTTITLDDNRRDELAKVCERHKLLILEDNATLDCTAAVRTPFQTRLPENVLHFSGSTRFISPGLRAAFVTYPKRFSERLLAGLHHTSIKASALDAEIISELTLSGEAERILAAKARLAKEANDIFDTCFHLPSTPGDTRLFRVYPLPGTEGHGPEVEEKYRAAGVIVCHSDRFSTMRLAKGAFLRLSLSSTPSFTQLKHALKKIERA